MKFNGSSWVGVGTEGFSDNEAQLDRTWLSIPILMNPMLPIMTRTLGSNQGCGQKIQQTHLKRFNFAYKKKRATKKITYTFQDLNLTAKKKNVKIWLGSKKLKMNSVKKRGYNVVVKATLKYKKMARGSYNLRMTYSGKRRGSDKIGNMDGK